MLLMFESVLTARSQNYNAVKGSSYAGSLGVMNNPASIVNTAYSWDLNILSLQVSSSTNAVTVLNYSLLSSPAGSQYRINKGDFGRYAKENVNLHLFNARIALNRRSAIAFGMNLRSYMDINTTRYNFSDTVKTLRNFLKVNENNNNLNASVKSNNWLEVFGTYSQTLWDNEQSRLNGGITLKGTRGIAAAFIGLQGTTFSRGMQNNKPVYFVNAGNINYGYSNNIDKWTKGRSPVQNIGDMIVSSQGDVSMDLGVEYLIKPQVITSFGDDDNYYEYQWKIGVSLLDLGASKYKYSAQSRIAVGSKADLTDTTLQHKFNKIGSMQSFNDSLATVFTGIQQISGSFSIINPVRLVINVDRHLSGNFYVNGEVSANLASFAGTDKFYSSEINMLTVTPRWETRRYGLYLPVQLNTERQFWIGGAFKVGPLLFGVHNLGNVFSQKKMQTGGAYLALVIRPGNYTKPHHDKRYNCPR
jgi:hypothetical protein